MGAKRSAAAGRPADQELRVGQRCAFVFGPSAGWARANGEECIIRAPEQRVDLWCADLDGGNRRYRRGVLRYFVSWRGGEVWTPRRNLRPLYDGDEVSTWGEFARATGFDLHRTVTARERALARWIAAGRLGT